MNKPPPVPHAPAVEDALIHLRVSRERKGRWVEKSRAAGKKLTDWIIERVEGATETAPVVVNNEPTKTKS